MSVAQCQEEVDSAEFTAWQARYAMDPWCEARRDAQAARICQQIAATGGVKASVRDFMPSFEPKDGPTIGQQAIQVFNAAASLARGIKKARGE